MKIKNKNCFQKIFSILPLLDTREEKNYILLS